MEGKGDYKLKDPEELLFWLITFIEVYVYVSVSYNLWLYSNNV